MPSQHRRKRRQWRGSATRSHSSVSKKRRATKASARRKKTSDRVPPCLGRTTRLALSCPAYVLYGLHGAFCAACRHERAKFALSIPALSGGRCHRTSRVVRWPTGASSRTPLRATSAAGPAPARPESAPVRPLERTHRALAPARPTRRSTVRCRPTLHGHHPSAWKREARHAAEAFLLQTAVQSLPRCRGGQAGARRRKQRAERAEVRMPSRSSRSLSRQEASMPQ